MTTSKNTSPALPRRLWLQGMGTLVLGLGASQLAWGAGILAVRLWPAADYTRLTIESDRQLVAHHFMTEAPNRLVIDIDQLALDPALKELVGKVRADDPYIAGVRVGQYQARVVRLVIDLKQPVQPQQFALSPVAAYQHRLVFDMYPTVAADPLDALLAERAASAPVAVADAGASSPVDDDPLGVWIAQSPQAPASPASTPTRTPDPAAATAVAAAPPQPPSAAAMPSATHAPAVAAAPAPPPAAAPPPTTPRKTRSAATRDRINRLIVVAIDPGHGGEDPGATGPSGLHEKDVVLQIALKLRDQINAQPAMRAVLTRDGDYFVPLHERVRKARAVQADLFISIHADAFLTPQARGASVFALSGRGASSASARWIANKENASDLVGGVNLAVKDSEVLSALLDMSTTAQIKDSMRVGSEVLRRIGTVGRLHKPRVEQAGFAVLKAPDIPSILVETAFISNPEEEQRLRDPAYQKQLVQAIHGGVVRYFAHNPPLAARDRTT